MSEVTLYNPQAVFIATSLSAGIVSSERLTPYPAN